LKSLPNRCENLSNVREKLRSFQTLKATGMAIQMSMSKTTLPVLMELMSPNWELMLCIALASILSLWNQTIKLTTHRDGGLVQCTPRKIPEPYTARHVPVESVWR
jgi:hypothetical protein